MTHGVEAAIRKTEQREWSRQELKKLPAEKAVELKLLSLPPERQALCLHGWEAIQDVTEILHAGGYTMRTDRVLTMLDVLTEDLPDLLWLSPDDAIPHAFKQLFRSWISLIEHALPREKLLSKREEDRMEVQALLAAGGQATKLLGKAWDYFEIKPAAPADPARQVA